MQRLHPIGPVLRPAFEPLLQIRQHAVPCAIEVGERLVPLAALAPTCVMQANARFLFADRSKAQHNKRSLLPRRRKMRRRVPVERQHLLRLQRHESHVIGAFQPGFSQRVDVDLKRAANFRLDFRVRREKADDPFARRPCVPCLVECRRYDNRLVDAALNGTCNPNRRKQKQSRKQFHRASHAS